MTVKQVLSELESLGTQQNIKVYKRHGAGENLYGVSFKNLRAMAKKLKSDDNLADELWDSGNTDARTLALLIADCKTIKLSTIDKWQKDINYYLLADLLADLVSQTKHADKLLEKWTNSNNEYSLALGYSLLAAMMKNQNSPDSKLLEDEIRKIEQAIKKSQNRAKHSMNMALIAIAIYNPALEQMVVDTANTIGKVEVDHGETGCKTPEIVPYINRAKARSTKKNAKSTK